MLARSVPKIHNPHALPPPLPVAFPESLSGLIERVTFFNEETGFGVLQVKAKGQRDLVTVVGSLPAANPGEWITAEGRWIQDRQFGLQFKAELLTSTAPTTFSVQWPRRKRNEPVS